MNQERSRLCGLFVVVGAISAFGADPATPIASGVASASAYAATPPPGFANWDAFMAAQLPLVRAVTEFEADVGVELPSRGLEPLGFAGFGGHEIEVVNNKIVIHWKGVPPAALNSILRKLESKHAVIIEVRPSPFSRAELDRAKAAVIADRANNGFVAAGDLPGASGIYLEVDRTPEQVRSLPATLAAKASLDSLRHPSSLAGDSVVVRTGTRMSLHSRDNDSSPYWGGARMSMDLAGAPQNFCSSGFGVRDGSWIYYMLSAAHCSNGVSGWTSRDGVGTFMGPVYAANQDNDASITNLIGASSGTRIYAGGLTPAETNKRVLSQTASSIGMIVCTSGSYSGERCSIQVKATNEFRSAPAPLSYVVGPMVRAEHTAMENASGKGDSGGPVFLPLTSDSLFAVGHIVGGDFSSASAPCTGTIYFGSGSRQCSWRLFYPQIGNTLNRLSVYLRTE